MGLNLPHLMPRCLNALCHKVKQRLRRWIKPDSQSLALNAVLDLSRSKSELVLENALLRRQVKRPALTWHDRALFVLIASKLATCKTALMIVQPDTLLRWHRDLFGRVWRHKSRRKGKKGRESLAEDIVRLIKNMAKDNRTWGAERIRFGVSRTPDDGWVAQQLREATPYGQGPRFLIRDNDNKYGAAFDRVAREPISTS